MEVSFRILLLLFVTLLLASCRCKQQAFIVDKPVTIQLKDSVRTEYLERITIDTVRVEIPVPMQSASTLAKDSVSILETDFAVSRVEIHPDGTFLHAIANKERTLEAEAYVPARNAERRETVYIDREIPVKVPYAVEVEKKLTAWQEFRIKAFWYLVIGVVIIVIVSYLVLRKRF